MAEEILASVQVRRDSKANWEAANPVLLDGEAAYEKDTDMFKIGDGVNNYNNLSYHNKVGPKGDTGSSGVYIGTSQPTDSNINVWIDSDGEPTEVIDDFAREEIGRLKSEIPTALPNPQPITINGQRYDGSEAVTVTVSSEGGGTPVEIDDTLTQSGQAADAKAVGDRLSALNEANAAQDKEIAKKVNDADLAKVAKSGSYTDLTNKPTIPTVPSALPNPNALTFTGAVNETYDGSTAKSVAIPTVPESLKNPNKLTFTGAVTAEYDGSTAVEVTIPEGGSGSYTLPIASPTTLGGVMPVAKTDDMTQAVGVDEAGRLWAMAGGGMNGFKLLAEATLEKEETGQIFVECSWSEYNDIVIFIDWKKPTENAFTGNKSIGLLTGTFGSVYPTFATVSVSGTANSDNMVFFEYIPYGSGRAMVFTKGSYPNYTNNMTYRISRSIVFRANDFYFGAGTKFLIFVR